LFTWFELAHFAHFVILLNLLIIKRQQLSFTPKRNAKYLKAL